MKKDENLFWFYRGQKDADESDDAQLENNFTKALFIVLKNCPNFRVDFLSKFFRLKTKSSDKLDFEMQTNKPKKIRPDKKTILFILAPEKSGVNDKKNKNRYSIPDGWIFTNKGNILVEVKISGNISEAQLRKHERIIGKKLKRVYRTWEQLASFLKVRKTENDSEIERFLLRQFNQFLEVEGMSTFSGFTEEDLNFFNREPGKDQETKHTVRRKFENFRKLIQIHRKLPKKLKFGKIGVIKEYSNNIWFPIDLPKIKYYNICLSLNLDELSIALVSSTQHTEYGKHFVQSIHDRQDNLLKFFNKHPEIIISIYKREKGRDADQWVRYDKWNEGLSISAELLNRKILNLGQIRTMFESLDGEKDCYAGIKLRFSISRAELLEKSSEKIIDETTEKIQLITQLSKKISNSKLRH